MSVSIITTDHVGIVARDESLVDLGLSPLFYLTSCCHAAVTGVSVTADNPGGIACKGCYAPVSPALAGEPAPVEVAGMRSTQLATGKVGPVRVSLIRVEVGFTTYYEVATLLDGRGNQWEVVDSNLAWEVEGRALFASTVKDVTS